MEIGGMVAKLVEMDGFVLEMVATLEEMGS